jgi:hypothetical protein
MAKKLNKRENRVQLDFNPEHKQSVSLTKQSFKDDCDINRILQGKVPDVSIVQTHFGDFSQIQPLGEALSAIAEVSSLFEELPAQTRLKFGNDIVQFQSALLQNDKAALEALGVKFQSDKAPVSEQTQTAQETAPTVEKSKDLSPEAEKKGS